MKVPVHKKLTISSTAVGLDSADTALAAWAKIQIKSGSIIYRLDGVDPVVGDDLSWDGFEGDVIPLSRVEMTRFKAIRFGTDDGLAKIIYYETP